MRYYTSIFVKGLQSYHKSKLEFWKNICRSARFEPTGPGSAELADIFSELQLWPLVSLQPLDQNQCLVPHLKDLFCICLGIKAQSFWMTFNVCNLGSKNPYLNRAYVVSGSFGWTHLYMVHYFSFWVYSSTYFSNRGKLLAWTYLKEMTFDVYS